MVVGKSVMAVEGIGWLQDLLEKIVRQIVRSGRVKGDI